jgi:hypothetical protein
MIPPNILLVSFPHTVFTKRPELAITTDAAFPLEEVSHRSRLNIGNKCSFSVKKAAPFGTEWNMAWENLL